MSGTHASDKKPCYLCHRIDVSIISTPPAVLYWSLVKPRTYFYFHLLHQCHPSHFSVTRPFSLPHKTRPDKRRTSFGLKFYFILSFCILQSGYYHCQNFPAYNESQTFTFLKAHGHVALAPRSPRVVRSGCF